MNAPKVLDTALIGLRHPHVGRVDPAKPSFGYIHTFKQLDGVRVVAYCEDADPSLLQHVRAFDPDAHTYASVDDLIAREDFELACVVLPANQVPPTGIKLAQAGKHFFMEKQFARTAADLAALARAIQATGVKVLAGYPWRFHPAMRDLKALLDAGVLGTPVSIESRLITTQVRTGARDPKHFMYTSANEGGGILHMLGGHWLELMRALLGCEVTAVTGMTSRPIGQLEAPLEDLAVATLEYANGALGTIHAGYLHPRLGGGYDSGLIVRGLEGWAAWAPVGAPSLTVKSAVSHWSGAAERTFAYELQPMSVYGGHRWSFDFMQGFV
ncbi:MAG: Gfo/Idh/MocA family oxidoreductase, partial [Actinobacteria bacterium]|nr:Gfo/Idh/MocA family oxidoreductase [Actinomycetota bacterium]